MIPRSYSWPDGHWDWYQHLAFKHGIRVGELVFVGGQVDKTAQGEPLNAYDLPRQTAAVVRHINTVLQGFGGSIEQVTKLVAFYSNDGRVDEQEFLADVGRCFLECAGKDFAGVGPVITPVPLPCLALPGMMVEIEAIALLPANGSMLARHTANPAGLPPLPTPFSHGLRAGPHIWVGAQSSKDADGAIQQAGEPVGQTGIVMDSLAKVLDELEVELSDVLKVGCWFDGDGTSATWAPGALERARHFESPGPVVTELPSPCLPAGETARVEAWAMRGIDGKPLQRDSVNSQSWQWPHPLLYSSAVRCEDLVFLSGHLPLDANGAPIHSGDLNRQTRQVMENTRATLQTFGLDLNHMVKQTSFFLGKADPKDIVTNQTLRSSYYNEPAGASTGVPMPLFALEDILVTVETIAML